MQAPCLKINKTPNQDRSRRATRNSTGQIGTRYGVKAKPYVPVSENNGKAPSSKKKVISAQATPDHDIQKRVRGLVVRACLPAVQL